MNVGITGHQELRGGSWEWVDAAIRKEINNFAAEEVVGVSSLAKGADQLFARIVVEYGYDLIVVLPMLGYRDRFVDNDDKIGFDLLSRKASRVEVLESVFRSDEEAYFEAGKEMVRYSDIVMAVWDGEKAAGLGGTGDVVEYALSVGKMVLHIEPASESVNLLKP